MPEGSSAALRRLPPVHALLADPLLADWAERIGRARVRAAVARALAEARADVRAGSAPPSGADVIGRVVRALATGARPRLRRVINATGIVLHTGLGRAPLAAAAVEAVARTAGSYCNLELDLPTGRRGTRHAVVDHALRALTGAEAALVVNNNAAAVLLVLAALAAGREAVVSRGELVEIGGSFRVPEVMAQSGVRLREVGTTNRTYAADYAAAIGPETAVLLKVHQSNFRVVGFAAAPSLAKLAALARAHGLPLVYDAGSGALVPGLGGGAAPDAAAALAAGVDLLTFSGDKLLGGPQAGIVCGRADLVAACARHPLARALRVDKLTLAALDATLELYRADRARREVPALAMLERAPEQLARAATALAEDIAARVGSACSVEVEEAESAAGAGALPAIGLPTRVVALRPSVGGAQRLHDALRRGEPPVVGRLRDDAVLLDPRTLLPPDLRELPALVADALVASG